MTVILFALSLVTIYPGAGTAGFDFLHISPTAREAALAGAAVSRPQGAMGFFYNPAILSQGGTNNGELTYINYPAGIHLGSVGYVQPLGTNKGVGIGIFYLNSGTIKRTNDQGEEMGTFGSSYLNLNLSGGLRIIDRLALGLAFSGLYGAIDTFFSLGVAGNLGITYEIPDYHIHFGFAASNLGVEVKTFGGYRNPLPLEIALGASWEPITALNLNASIHKPIDNRWNFRAGIEGWVNEYLVLRGGYYSLGADLAYGGGGDVLAGFTTGLGIRYQRYQIDYAFIPMVVLGITHRLSLSFSL
ncbi:MAG: PorV/PorQ family protein [candidate division WOR-3 bacterium]